MKIGIVIGSVRQGRKGETVARWVLDHTRGRDTSYELVDLAAFNLPVLTDPVVPGAAQRKYSDPAARAWGEAIDGYDGFVFVTPEYNHSIPGGFKNAFDTIYPEWGNKAVAFVSYGADGGVRAVEHWRAVVANAHLFAVREQVSLSAFTEFDADGALVLQERRDAEIVALLDRLEAVSAAIATLR